MSSLFFSLFNLGCANKTDYVVSPGSQHHSKVGLDRFIIEEPSYLRTSSHAKSYHKIHAIDNNSLELENLLKRIISNVSINSVHYDNPADINPLELVTYTTKIIATTSSTNSIVVRLESIIIALINNDSEYAEKMFSLSDMVEIMASINAVFFDMKMQQSSTLFILLTEDILLLMVSDDICKITCELFIIHNFLC